MVETILQSDLALYMILPLLLVFTVVFAILEKSKVLGDGKRQINAITSLVIALIAVAFANITDIIVNLMPFLALATVIILVFLILWGFVASDKKGLKLNKGIKITFGIIIAIAIIIAVIVASGQWDFVYSNLFKEGWSSDLWATILLLAVIGGAIAIVLSGGKRDNNKDNDDGP